jgi:hypothetical protein
VLTRQVAELAAPEAAGRPELADGARVMLHGLSSVEGARLNGRAGAVVGRAASSGRYKVALDGAEPGALPKALKAENLRALPSFTFAFDGFGTAAGADPGSAAGGGGPFVFGGRAAGPGPGSDPVPESGSDSADSDL